MEVRIYIFLNTNFFTENKWNTNHKTRISDEDINHDGKLIRVETHFIIDGSNMFKVCFIKINDQWKCSVGE